MWTTFGGILPQATPQTQGWWQGEQKFTTPGDIPQGLSLVTVITDYFSKLSAFAFDAVKQEYGSDMTMGDVQWCLTVPRIWDDFAIQTLRECLERAGMVTGPFCSPQAAARASSHPPLFLLEWEAAALFFFSGYDIMGSDSVQKGSEVLVVDLRRDSMNIVTLKEYQGSFILVTGRTVDGSWWLNVERFYNVLRATIRCFDELEQQNPIIRSDLLKTWHSFVLRRWTKKRVCLKLPTSLTDAWRAYSPGKTLRDSVTFRPDTIFDPVADQLIQLIEEHCRADIKEVCLMCDYLLLHYLEPRIQAFKPRCGATLWSQSSRHETMANGACMFALSPALQASRRTYELELQRPCSLYPKLHIPSSQARPTPGGAPLSNEQNREPRLLENDKTSLELVQERLSEFDGSFRSCLEAINMACPQAIHSLDASEALAAIIMETHDNSIRHAKLTMAASLEFQSRRWRHSQSEMETAQLSKLSKKRKYQEKLQTLQRERCEALGCARTLEEETRKLEAEKVACQKEVDTLKAKSNRMEAEQMSCQICMDRPCNVVILPCCHAQYCDVCMTECRKTTGTCPTCRLAISGFLPFFS